jgi:hypothetical protein
MQWIFLARLVACGYTQVPGVDFQESVAPVINDVTFFILLKGKIVDIKTVFVHENLKEKIYIEIPKGMEANENECLILKKSIYGLVQSTREFYKKLVLALKGCSFQGNSVNPCLWTKYTEHGIVSVGIYVDNRLVIGNENGINDVINELKAYKFGLKIANDLKEYLRCNLD